MEQEVEDEFASLDVNGQDDDAIGFTGSDPEQVEGRIDLCLVGRFITNKTINFTAMKSRMGELWKPTEGVHFRTLNNNKYLFQFFHRLDLKRVIEGGPWSFDYCPLIVKTLKDGDNPSKIPLNGMDIWVRLYDVPIGYVNEAMAKLMGNYIGIYIQYDPKNANEVWKDYMRARVRFDVRQPLKKHKKFIKRDGSVAKITFKYERLPSFCFVCGIIGHSEKHCKKAYDLDREGQKPVRGWGWS